MIRIKELNPHNHPLSEAQVENLLTLLEAMNAVRASFGRPMIVTSGFRSWEEHASIYKPKGIKPPKGSCHLQAAACDIWDRDGSLWAWCMRDIFEDANRTKLRKDSLLAKHGLYLEDRTKTPTWVHFQILPPRSGNRIFLP